MSSKSFIIPADAHTIDPIRFAALLWPNVRFYDKQKEIIYSVMHNRETVVPAGNMLGKDFVSAYIVLWFFLTRTPCRVLTTSADHSQLQGVLWGEINRFIQSAKYPLEAHKGGPLKVNDLHIRKIDPTTGVDCKISYIKGRVAKKGEGLAGHHVTPVSEEGQPVDDGIVRTLAVTDEASGVEEVVKERFDGWAKRFLVIGNPFPCANFFYHGTKEGDLPDEPSKLPDVQTYRRKVIQIKAEHSPNVQYALAEIKSHLPISNRTVVPGVISYEEYLWRRKNWDAVKQSIGLDAEFYEGAEILMFPPLWLDRAENLFKRLKELAQPRFAKAMGIDPAEGGDKTAWAVSDERGVLEIISERTPNTAVIVRKTIDIGRKHNLHPSRWFFDRGGGGKQHADVLRERGFPVHTVAFGEPVTPKKRRGLKPLIVDRDEREERYVCKNRRAEMYMCLRLLLEPNLLNPELPGFALPSDPELRKQLAPIPLLYEGGASGEGRVFLPPKTSSPNSAIKSLTELIGHSPDEADAVVLSVWGQTYGLKKKVRVGKSW